MSSRVAIVLPDAADAAEACGQRLAAFLLERQSISTPVNVALTGGTLGIELLAHLWTNTLVDAISWPDVHVWWGDERVLPEGDPDRNDTQARTALLSHVPIPPENIHAVGYGPVESVAAAYAEALEGVSLDLVLLGVGPDGHVASLFPGLPGIEVTDRLVVGVEDSPKPPPVRVSLTLPAINAAGEVWLIAAGTGKSKAVSRALHDDESIPASRVAGRDRTLWFLDTEAATPPE
jgi:6-phosphogluconolactonase